MVASTGLADTIPRPLHTASSPPIVDLRARLPWPGRLPGRLGTAALWLGSCSLLGPTKRAVVLLAGSLMVPCLSLLERSRADTLPRLASLASDAVELLPPAAQGPLSAGGAVPEAPGLRRAALAAQLGLSGSLLFRARHAALCTVHHDVEGRIVALELPGAALPLSLPSPDAHPVG